MRGIVSHKLTDFLNQVADTASTAAAQGVELTPTLVRANLDKLSALIGEGPALEYVKEASLSTPENIEIKVNVYSPAPKEALPVVLHFHGGGHMAGSIALYDTISRKIAKAGHCIVIAVEYRLAPEYPYPYGIDDSQYILANYQQLLSELAFNKQLIIAGDSAGGAICTTLASNNRQSNTINISKQILIYPSVDYTMSCESVEENGRGFLLEKSKIQWYFDHYFQANQSREAASPLYMPIDKNLPKTLIFTAGCDPLRDEGVVYKYALIAEGVCVEHHQFDDMIHAYMLLDTLVQDECEKTYQLIGEFIKK